MRNWFDWLFETAAQQRARQREERKIAKRDAEIGFLIGLSQGKLPSVGFRAETSPLTAAGPILIGLGLIAWAFVATTAPARRRRAHKIDED